MNKKRLIYGADYNCIYENLPSSVKGFVLRDCSDFYTICVNSRHSIETQLKTIQHELEHILNDDFSEYDADSIEKYSSE